MSKFKTITSFDTLQKCIEQLDKLGCKVSKRHLKTLKEKQLIIFRNNLIILDEFNLLT